METIEVPVRIVEIIQWMVITGMLCGTVLMWVMLSSIRDASQQKQQTRETIIRNERANIMVGINTGLEVPTNPLLTKARITDEPKTTTKKTTKKTDD